MLKEQVAKMLQQLSLGMLPKTLIVQTDWQQQFVIFNSGKVIGEKSYTRIL
jgi:hypothetical protein